MKSAISWLDRCVCGVHALLNERGWCQGWLVLIIDEVVRDGEKNNRCFDLREMAIPPWKSRMQCG